MPRSLFTLSFVAAAVAILTGIQMTGTSAGIEAVEGKRYVLNKAHGPWTIMVASFQDIPDTRVEVVDGRARRVRNEQYLAGGSSAQEAADKLVLELRKYGIPAYTFEQKVEYEKARTVDRLKRVRDRTYTARQRNIAVLAGNYKSAQTDTAQQTLALVKRFQPQFLTQGGQTGYTTHSATGAAFHPTPGNPTPLSGAFLTINPLLTAEEARRMSGQRNPLIAKLNSGSEFPLVHAKGKYTVQVATFYGNSTAHRFGEKPKESFFDSDGSSLDKAATDARTMMLFMRKTGTPAFVHHEQFQSIVTVGEFNSPNDPGIRNLLTFFGPKQVRDPKTGKPVVRYEFLAIPATRQGELGRTLPIDPEPKLIEIPRI